MRLRSHLALLTFGTLLPVALVGAVAAWLFVEHDRDNFRRATLERALALGTAVDAEIEGTIATARALGEALDVNAADYSGFRAVAQRILATQPHWSNINLALANGQQVVNLALPAAAKLHSIVGIDDSVERIQRDRKPVVNDIAYGKATQAWDVAIRVPVLRDGQTKYILSAIVRPESISALLEAQRLPADWGAVVVDRKGNIVGRTPQGKFTAGDPASPNLRERLSGPPSGWFRGVTRESDDVYTAYQRSPLTGWTVAMRVPVAVVDGVAARASWIGAFALLVALALAIALAAIISRRIEEPIVALADTAAAIGRGEHPEVSAMSSVSELAKLGAALQAASAAIADRQRLAEGEREALKSMDRSKNQFIAMLSHELRNPLAPIVIGADLLRRNKDPAVEETASMIKRQAGQITSLIEDLLDISGIVMGKVSLERRRLDLAEVAREVADTWRTAGRFARHRVELALEPAWIEADRSRIEQIVSNLLANSLKFTPAGGSVTLITRAHGDRSVLEVADTGKGLPPDMLEAVFDPFVQGRQNIARPEGGLGIGLALVKQLATLHGGNASMESEGPGRGARVRVVLPRVTPPALPRQRKADPRRRAGRRLRILLVEDNDDTRRMLRAALQAEGHELHEAADGLEAIHAAEKVEVDLALVDIGLPKADGYQVARALRRRFDGAVVLVALTGYGQSDDRKRALSEGFDEHMVKPVTPERLASVIAESAARLS
jgi:signal transduction histidine kinase